MASCKSETNTLYPTNIYFRKCVEIQYFILILHNNRVLAQHVNRVLVQHVNRVLTHKRKKEKWQHLEKN